MIQAEDATVPADNDADHHYQTADELHQRHQHWLVLWGAFTREYVAFPLFHPLGRTILHTTDPEELVARMQQVEERMERYRARQPRAYPDL